MIVEATRRIERGGLQPAAIGAFVDTAFFEPLDMTRSFLPEALGGSTPYRASSEEQLWLNQIRACSYVHLFDVVERSLSDAVQERAAQDVDARDQLAPLLRFDVFNHHSFFERFENAFSSSFGVRPHLAPVPEDFVETLKLSAPLALLVLSLHLKLMTQQHYLACVRGDESLEPQFVRLLKEHWLAECEPAGASSTPLEIQRALSSATRGRAPAALRDYRRLLFSLDELIRSEAELDVRTLDDIRTPKHGPLNSREREAATTAERDALRKTFLTMGVVNAAFVYSMRSLGPSAPATLAGIVSALASRS